MTSLERLIAASRGEEVDQKPVIEWPGEATEASDVVVTLSGEFPAPATGQAWIVQVGNVYTQCLTAEVPILRILEEDPAEGDRLLNEATDRVRRAMDLARTAASDGIIFCVAGATPEHMSPMAYGGHFLERDRSLLEEFADTPFTCAFVVGGKGAYLDFVSDLPAHAFGWDVEGTGVPLQSIRAMRAGALATTDPASDIILVPQVDQVTQFLENQSSGTGL